MKRFTSFGTIEQAVIVTQNQLSNTEAINIIRSDNVSERLQ